LAWGQVYRLHNLDDEEKWAALKLKATSSAIPISDDAISYLMMHANRDMPSLMQSLEQLDRLSLSSQRTITVPTVRAYLATIPT
jgi:DnaA family protein